MIQILSFEPQTFFLFLLPPIIYESGYSLRVKPFLKNLIPVLTMTVLATVFATGLFGVTFWYGT